ncbi:hypothetical protein A6R70_14380 [Agrobacterium rubi]|uniref:hypothetical protein n=1 Tax=Agrobacterium rubi TaxID=28099 RepID=UPI00201B8FD6|nr:hypothetical protein [Agrobacterium rubi]MCL6653476.1 hypothetical protein [Agrobacterium rubi]
MADFATLVLAADSRSLKAGEQDLNSIASTAERTERRVTKSADGMAKGLTAVGKQSAFAGQQMRMTSMQLSQVAQQASVTGDWLQAIAIQLPDLALGLGPIGILAGAAAGALLPLAANLLTAQGEASGLTDKIKDLEVATEAYEEAVANASLSGKELVERFGEQAEGAQRAYEALRQLRELEYGDKLKAASDAIQASLQDIESSVDRFQSATLNFLPKEAIMVAQQETQYLAREFGITAIQAHEITNALNELGDATGPKQVAEASMNLSNALKEAAAEGANLPPSLREVQKEALRTYLEASRFEQLLGTANETAGTLAGTMGTVANEANRAANNIAAAVDAQRTKAIVDQLGPLNTLNGFNRTPFQNEMDIQNERAENTKSQYQLEQERLAKSRRSGGSRRKSGADMGLDNDHREAVRIFEETRTAAEKYANELERVDDLYNRGFINADTYGRAVEQLKEQYHETSEMAQFFTDTLYDSFSELIPQIETGNKALDHFLNTLIEAVLQAALLGEGPFAGLGGGKNGGGGLLSKLFSFDGGGYTGEGSRSGGLDGKGGFMALVHPNETVVDHSKGQSLGGGQSNSHVTVSVDNNGNLQAYVQKEAARVTKAGLQSYDKGSVARQSMNMKQVAQRGLYK